MLTEIIAYYKEGRMKWIDNDVSEIAPYIHSMMVYHLTKLIESCGLQFT